jgi:hypothetical protein
MPSNSTSAAKLRNHAVQKLSLTRKLVIGQKPDAERHNRQDYEQRIHGA